MPIFHRLPDMGIFQYLNQEYRTVLKRENGDKPKTYSSFLMTK